MQLERYIGLYLSETREHLRALNRGLLALESAGGGVPLDEAFRSAHTIKGMAATMGYRAVAELAHALEDRLDEVRSGGRAVEGALIDRLLADTDALESAVEQAVAEAVPAGPLEPELEAEPVGGATASAGVTWGGPAPPGTELIVRVALEQTCALKAARAHIITRNATQTGALLGTAPAEIDDRFDGVLHLYVASGVEPAELEARIRAAGDVATVAFETAIAASSHVGAPSQSANGATRSRHVRVEERHVIDLADGIGDLAVLFGELRRIAGPGGAPELSEVMDRVGRRVMELQHAVLAVRMEPVGEVFDRFPRVVRDAARSLDKEVDFLLEGRDIELDRQILEELADPLVHLLRNAVGHGLEAPADRVAAGKPVRGRVTLRATRDRSHVVIEVADDGQGVARDRVMERAAALGLVDAGRADTVSDEELLRLLSQPGLSTSESVSDLSGRGVGLDAVVNRIRTLGGAVALQSAPGEGTTVTLRMPITLALSHALRVQVGGEDYAIPLTHIAEAVYLDPDQVEQEEGGEVLRLRGEALPLVRLCSVLGTAEGAAAAAVITELGDRRGALAVDGLVGREQIVVKGFDSAIGALPIFSGATLLADGRPALVLDPISVF